ncbi:endonuclease/exonuclease/phosphatase family protein [Granulicella arctica]|uniref:endonuclease/exonuclease/phosphatase family protein n=1 Tax=Granulicella arctica TaxID=940613 RepID=UPI0021DF9B30|nr:endonuclease/exonuclease/phosphatase family protein [Granulicella arctica]
MPNLTVLSLNMQGVPASQIAAAILTIKPDIVALQEVPATSSFYAELSHGLKSSGDYAYTGPVREYPNPPPIIGRQYLDAQGSMKQIFVLYKQSVLQLSKKLGLVNFLNDANITAPRSVQEARGQGFAARPPAYCRFTMTATGESVGLFTWHAPTRVDAAHRAALDHFDDSFVLDQAVLKNHLTILAGDFNNDNLTNYFADFQQGIQHKFDYILGDQATSCADLSNGPHKGLLDSLCTKTQDHFAMGATFTF